MQDRGSFDFSPCPEDPANDDDVLRERAVHDDDDDWRGPLLRVSKPPVSQVGQVYAPPVTPIALAVSEEISGNTGLQDLADQLVIHRLLFLLYSQAHFVCSRDGGRQRFPRPYQLDWGAPWDRLFKADGQDAAAILDYKNALDAHLRCCMNYVTNPARLRPDFSTPDSLKRRLDSRPDPDQLKWTVSDMGADVLSRSSHRLLHAGGACMASISDDSIRMEISRTRQIVWPDEFADRDWQQGIPINGAYPNVVSETACRIARAALTVKTASENGLHEGTKPPCRWNELTKRQQHIYVAHQRMVTELNRPPSTRQLGEAMGCSHTTVANEIKSIEQILGTPLPGREAASRREHTTGNMDNFGDR
jgi:hypothetical protein